MGTHIDYPTQTSGWGKALIDTLNTVVHNLETQMSSVSSKLAIVSSEIATVNVTLNTFREEIFNKVDEIKTVATSALTLAKENQECTKSIRDEMTNHKLSYDKSLQDIRSEIDTIKQSNENIRDENKYLRFTCEQLTSKNKLLTQHTNNLENYSRRNNLLIRGLPVVPQETDDMCEQTTRNFLKKQLKLTDASVDNMQFVGCHRLFVRGNQHQQKRPIIVRFYNYKDKAAVWKAKTKLTDGRYSISDDFSRGTEYNRRKLYAIYKKAKSMDKYKKISLNGDTLIIDSVRYNVESLNMLPKDLEPRQFAERTNGNLLIVGGFHSSHQPLSNWYQCDVRHSGHTFANVEQAYQWCKATFAKDAVAAGKLLYCTDPRDAKALGMAVKGLNMNDWNNTKNDTMKELVKSKFTHNTELKTELLDTGDLILAEAGVDTHFAIGLPLQNSDIFDSKKWKGQNYLGKILCEVRADLSI